MGFGWISLVVSVFDQIVDSAFLAWCGTRGSSRRSQMVVCLSIIWLGYGHTGMSLGEANGKRTAGNQEQLRIMALRGVAAFCVVRRYSIASKLGGHKKP